MLVLPEAAGPHDPVLTTPLRAPGSVRRTSSIDTARPDGLRATATVDGRARDVRTGTDGGLYVVGEATLHATIDAQRSLLSIETSPPLPDLDELLGALVGPGFRARVDLLAGAERDRCSLLYLLLDDLPGATLVSGYAVQRGGAEGAPASGVSQTAKPLDVGVRHDLCAGWALDATMMVTIRERGEIPVPIGPPAPVLERADDPAGWHAMAPLAPHGMRRRRRLDVLPAQAGGHEHGLDVHFRDSHVDDGGVESVVHEYTVLARVDRRASTVVSSSATAHVLPWMECPGAVASAERIAGMELGSLRPRVRQEFVGRSTCTHLNDTLRSLTDVPVLLQALEAES